MSPSTQRTLIRLFALFLATGAGDAVVQWATTGFYDWRHLAAGLVVAAIMALEKWLSEQSASLAAPTVNAVNAALENQSASVPPPTVSVPSNPPTLLH